MRAVSTQLNGLTFRHALSLSTLSVWNARLSAARSVVQVRLVDARRERELPRRWPARRAFASPRRSGKDGALASASRNRRNRSAVNEATSSPSSLGPMNAVSRYRASARPQGVDRRLQHAPVGVHRGSDRIGRPSPVVGPRALARSWAWAKLRMRYRRPRKIVGDDDHHPRFADFEGVLPPAIVAPHQPRAGPPASFR